MQGIRSRWYLIENDDDYDDNDDDDNVDDDDDNDHYSCNSVNLEIRTSKFCMEVNLDNI